MTTEGRDGQAARRLENCKQENGEVGGACRN